MAAAPVRFASGDRVAVRTRLPAAERPGGQGPRLTDTVGTIREVTPTHLVLDTRRGEVVLERAAVVAARHIPPAPARREPRRRPGPDPSVEDGVGT